MNIICWNCRGLGNPNAIPSLKSLVKDYSPFLLFLSETKLSSTAMNKIRLQIGFASGFHVNNVETRGGLSLLWNDATSVQIVNSSIGYIDSIITFQDKVFRFTGFYGNPKQKLRHVSWTLLRRIATNVQRPWLCAGDFNEVLTMSEKTGDVQRPRYLMNNFREALTDCNLKDLGYTGAKYTWNNGRPQGYVKARLDRAVADDNWIYLFPNFSVTHLSVARSDHFPILISDQTFHNKRKTHKHKLSRFDPFWLQDPECLEVSEAAWKNTRQNCGKDCVKSIEEVRNSLCQWSSKKYGKLSMKIEKRKEMLENYQQLANNGDVALEKSMMKELDLLLNMQEDYWKQRGRADWLKSGDRNTTFFHKLASRRKEKNTIKSLITDEGRILTKKKDIQNHAREFYTNLFSSYAGEHNLEGLDRIAFNTINVDQQFQLLKPYNEVEILKALKHLSGRKSPGPDGMQAIFLQKHWHLYRNNLLPFILDVLNNGSDFTALNDTHIALIPKVPQANQLRDFRPISLSNTIYKIISKTVANRLKLTLNDVIDPAQSAFQKGRLITDNALATFEAFHTLNGDGNNGRNQMALKLDMVKAFDRIEWDYLEKILELMHYPRAFVTLILKCVTTASFKVLINGQPTSTFRPTRGIRQGDPLSPFLFILCSQGLTALINHSIMAGSLTPFRFGKDGPCLSHLLFADDIILFAKADVVNATEIQNILSTYESLSGQKVNVGKSNIYFNKAECPNTIANICQILSFTIGQANGKYLGLPFMVGRSKYEIFKYLKDRIWKKLNGWKTLYLSTAGKEVLIKAIVQAIPIFVMQCFKLPKKLLNKILGMVRKFWWGNDPDKKTLAWISWEKICTPKDQGGLGFKDMETFNQGLLAKQCWRLLNNPHSLVGSILKFKYHRRTSFMEAKMGYRPSYIWSSLMYGKNLLKLGTRWSVRMGSSIDIWKEPWVPLQPTFKITTPKPINTTLTTVDKLISNGDWNIEMLKETLHPHDVDAITSIPIRQTTHPDRLIWHFTQNGIYSVKSGYKEALYVKQKMKNNGEGSNPQSNRRAWNYLWKLEIQPKIKAFLWRLATNSLPVGEALRTKQITNGLCPICKSSTETWAHCFFDCTWIRSFWRNLHDFNDFTKLQHTSFIDLCYHLSSNQIFNDNLFFCMLWLIWLERNQVAFNGGNPNCNRIENQASSMLAEYQRAISVEFVSFCPPPLNNRWTLPTEGCIKTNVDAGFKDGRGTIGVLIRRSDGTLSAAFSYDLGRIHSPEFAEMKAILLGTLESARCWNGMICIESDSKNCITRLNSDEEDLSPLGSLVTRIRRASRYFSSCNFQFIKRNCNIPADMLATIGFSLPIQQSGCCNWGTQPPNFVLSALVADIDF